MKKLTNKQKLFCDYYIHYGNATYSAKKAGYSKRSARQIANRLITKDSIQNYIHQKLHQISSHQILSAKDVLKFLSNVVKGNIKDEYAIGTADGVYTGEKQPSITDKITACHLLMKRYEPLYRAKVAKAQSEARIKKFTADHTASSSNAEENKVDEVLDAIFENNGTNRQRYEDGIKYEREHGGDNQ